ncbi:ESAT-6 like protein EsxL, partial [Mycobacterium tuberculosis KT-0063]
NMAQTDSAVGSSWA